MGSSPEQEQRKPAAHPGYDRVGHGVFTDHLAAGEGVGDAYAIDLGRDWYWLDRPGFFNLVFRSRVYHLQHGFLYRFGIEIGKVVFWDNIRQTAW